MMKIFSGGARVRVSSPAPSIDLASLCGELTKILEQDSGFASFQDGRLVLDTVRPVLALFNEKDFKERFRADGSHAFIRDFHPSSGPVKLGSRLFDESDAVAAVRKLHDAVSKAIDRALGEVSAEFFSTIASPQPQKEDGEMQAAIIPFSFGGTDAPPIARIFAARESLDTEDWGQRLTEAIRRYLERYPEAKADDIAETVKNFRARLQDRTSQPSRFLHFLAGAALSRVRVRLSIEIMGIIAEKSRNPALIRYVQRIAEAYRVVVEENASLPPLDMLASFTHAVVFDEYLSRVSSYYCLPVWLDWISQLYETRIEGEDGVRIKREISCRFRLNGKNPTTGKTAYAERLGRIRERLLGEDYGKKNLAIADLLFLWISVPKEGQPDVLDELKDAINAIRRDPEGKSLEMLNALAGLEPTVREIASAMVTTLRDRKSIYTEITGRPYRFVVTVDSSVLADQYDIIHNLAKEPFVKSSADDTDHATGEKIEWFHRLRVRMGSGIAQSELGSFVSYDVETVIQEKNLLPAPHREFLDMRRETAQPTLSIRMLPDGSDAPKPDLLPVPPKVDVYYLPRVLRLRDRTQDRGNRTQDRECMRLASVSAVSVLAYVALFTILRRAAEALGGRQPYVPIVRSQNGADGADPGNDVMYAVSRALELALSREASVKVQGIVLDGREDRKLRAYKEAGTRHALSSGYPIRFQMSGALDRVALITYAVRPVDSHPDPAQTIQLVIAKTYTAERDGASGILRADRVALACVRKDEAGYLREVREEVARLANEGYRHILLLSHQHGERRIGRIFHGDFPGFGELVRQHPSLYLYTLFRDVIPAIRMRRRGKGESAFEISGYTEHRDMHAPPTATELLPVYTIATMTVVGDELGEYQKPHSGCCTYYWYSSAGIADLARAEEIRQNILGVGAGKPCHESLVSVLRVIHFLESESPPRGKVLIPVLDPYWWVRPEEAVVAGEIPAMENGGLAMLNFSITALLAQVGNILRGHHDAVVRSPS